MTAEDLLYLLFNSDRLSDEEFRDTEYLEQRIDIHLENIGIVGGDVATLAKEVQALYGI